VKLFIGSSIWRTEETAYSSSMRLLARHLDAQKIDFFDGALVGDADVCRSRSMTASAFLRSDCDVYVSIDSDIWFRPEDVVQISRKAAQGSDIVVGMYITRKPPHQPAQMLPPDVEVEFKVGAPLVEIPYGAAGFMAVSKRVFKRLVDDLPHCHSGWTDAAGKDASFWPFFMQGTLPDPVEENIYLSEDWAFFNRAKEAGFKIWLDPSVRLGHMATLMLTLEDLARPARPEAGPMKLKRHADGTLEIFTPDPVAA